MKIFITGAQGFVGGALARRLAHDGYAITGCSHRPAAGLQPFDLRRPEMSVDFSGCSVVVHCAHYFGPDATELNFRATTTLMHRAARAGVLHQIFISSVAAQPLAESEYGKIKYRLEREFLAHDHAVVRPGLVLGAGGLFGRNLSFLLHAPFVPLIDGGRNRIPVIALDDLLSALEKLIEQGSRGEHNWFYEPLIASDDLVRTVGKAAGIRLRIVRVPSALALFAVGLAKKIGVPLPITRENILGGKQNSNGVHRSTLHALGLPLDTVLTAIRKALTARGDLPGRSFFKISPGAIIKG